MSRTIDVYSAELIELEEGQKSFFILQRTGDDIDKFRDTVRWEVNPAVKYKPETRATFSTSKQTQKEYVTNWDVIITHPLYDGYSEYAPGLDDWVWEKSATRYDHTSFSETRITFQPGDRFAMVLSLPVLTYGLRKQNSLR